MFSDLVSSSGDKFAICYSTIPESMSCEIVIIYDLSIIISKLGFKKFSTFYSLITLIQF